MSVQCWHCGKFRKREDVKVRRDREVWEDVLDQLCRDCDYKKGKHADICCCMFCTSPKESAQ